MEEFKNKKIVILPVISIRNLVLFPGGMYNFEIIRKASILAVEETMKSNQFVFVVTCRNNVNIPEDDQGDANKKSVFEYGVICKIHQIFRQKDRSCRVLFEGLTRAKLLEINKENMFLQGKLEIIKRKPPILNDERTALLRQTKELFSEYLSHCGKIPPDLLVNALTIRNIDELSDYVSSNIIVNYEEKQKLLETLNPDQRTKKLLKILTKEIDIFKLEQKIVVNLKRSIDKRNHEYFLREQLNIVRKELGKIDSKGEESDDDYNISDTLIFRKKILKLGLPKKIENKLLHDVNSLEELPSVSGETGMLREYIETCLGLPWNKFSKENIDISQAEKILNRDHYGLIDVKERILEILAIRQMEALKNSKKSKNNKNDKDSKNCVKTQTICLVGPPGVGKTSIARSMAKAMGRKFIKISLGGVHDESEIRGHRRTYVGAMPGRVISALKTVSTSNPLILLDEIDKLSNDYRGDPSSALLEVLDSEQNFEFFDRYLDFPFDLSNVNFVATANDAQNIPRPLFDRMEIINLYSYTHNEKFQIAKKHLIHKQLKKNFLTRSNFEITDKALNKIISRYTKEAGVRELERKISALMRKAAKILILKKDKKIKIDEDSLVKFLGPEKYSSEKVCKQKEIGVVRGLAWTSVGGETMPIEVALMDGKGKIQITGSLGDVMKESAQIAVSYIRSNTKKFGIDKKIYSKTDIHIHAPEGAVPKDGPSAGITMATAIVSALSKTPVQQNIAMTGEVTLKGKVLPIGGLKEKTMAAYKAGVETVIIPSENKHDLQKIDDTVRNSIKFVLAENLDTVFDTVFHNKFRETSN